MKIRDIRHTDSFFIRDFDCEIIKLSSINKMVDNSIGFLGGEQDDKFYFSNKTLIVLPIGLKEKYSNKEQGNFIFSENPRLRFIKIADQVLERHPVKEYIEIGNNFIRGENCVIKNCTIGNNVTIHSGTVLGESGFGFCKNGNKILQFPHVGRVIIEDDVEIHSNSCIDRGSLSDTIIKKGCKIDNLVHIAHNVEIGEGTFIIAQSMIGGSSKIGKNCWIAPGVKIIDGITIADNTIIGIGSVVIRNIEEPNGTWVGIPVRRLR